MGLKDKILKEDNRARCINCANYERLDTAHKPSYCKATDKLILEMHVECSRVCKNFERKVDVKS